MKALSYDDITLVPKYSEVRSRKDCDTSVKFLGHEFKLPLMPANMKASIDLVSAEWLSKNGYFYALHRFYEYEIILNWVRSEQNLPCISISVGVKQKDKELILKIAKSQLRVDFITIDIAMGHSILMKEMIEFIKGSGLNSKIIAGNVATSDGVTDLEIWGADAIKCNIGSGACCTTRLQTGFGTPAFTCIQECSGSATVPLIADGGIRYTGDIAKALVAGADMVMSGSMFARCLDSPADIYHYNPDNSKGNLYEYRMSKSGIIKKEFVNYKVWYGSSTHHNKGYLEHNEGRRVIEKASDMTYEQFLSYVGEHLRSAISYAGGKDLSVFNETEYIKL